MLRKTKRRTVRRSTARTSRRSHQTRRGQGINRIALIGGIAVSVIALLVAGVLALNGAFGAPKAAAGPRDTSADVEAVLVYTAPTSTEASVFFPESIRETFRSMGRAEQQIAVVRVEADGGVQQEHVDLTPRSSNGNVLKVEDRANQAIDRTVDSVLAKVTEPSGGGSTNRAMYTGLLKSTFPAGKPIYIITSLDLADPVDFRKLAFGVAPDRLVEVLKASGQVPDIDASPVTFILSPADGGQPQLRAAEKKYVKDVWTAILTNASGASSVTFIDAQGGPSRASGETPIVPLPDLPGTPIKPVKDQVGETVCAVPSTTYFEYGSAVLTDPAKTADALRSCIEKAIVANAKIRIDAWTSYEGPLDAKGRPTGNPSTDIRLSQSRAEEIRRVLIERLNVPAGNIDEPRGHGSENQPDPDPRSAANRVTTIRYTS